MDPINLDGMTLEELQELEPALLLLWQYTEIKIKAMQARVAGDIPDALTLESYCETIYNHMPASARW